MKKLLLSLVLSLSTFSLFAQATVDTVATTAPNFGVFSQLGNYGPLGLAVLALGYVAWMFLKRQWAEKDRLQSELDSKRKLTTKSKK